MNGKALLDAMKMLVHPSAAYMPDKHHLDARPLLAMRMKTVENLEQKTKTMSTTVQHVVPMHRVIAPML